MEVSQEPSGFIGDGTQMKTTSQALMAPLSWGAPGLVSYMTVSGPQSLCMA